MEPQLVCECEVPSSVMDLRFLDEQRVVGSFSNGCVAVFKYKNMLKVYIAVYTCVVIRPCPTLHAHALTL